MLWVGMFRSVVAVPLLRRLVADRSPRSAGLHPGPVSVRPQIYAAANCMLFVTCVFLQPYYYPTPVVCDAPFMTYINSYMFRHQGVINCVPRSAFVG
jgi:hypothetical protein